MVRFSTPRMAGFRALAGENRHQSPTVHGGDGLRFYQRIADSQYGLRQYGEKENHGAYRYGAIPKRDVPARGLQTLGGDRRQVPQLPVDRF